MLRFDIALQALKRRLTQGGRKEKPAPPPKAPPPEKPAGVLIPFPLRKLAVPAPPAKHRAPR